MTEFFGENVLLHSTEANNLYREVKDLPIIDYHCHLEAEEIARDATFSDIGEFWLAHDHYKWRAMRLNGIDERCVTGNASYHEKFMKYAEIMPSLIGNPLYYWTHLELKQIFGICKPLNKNTAEEIYTAANRKLKTLSVREILKQFRVEYIATTNDPTDDLHNHGVYGSTTVAPTFRPDRVYQFDRTYYEKLGRLVGNPVRTLSDLLSALQNRLAFFISKGCRISDHGFEHFPLTYATREEAEVLFQKGENMTKEEREAYFGFLLTWLAGQYAENNVSMQVHFGVVRNVNEEGFRRCGADSGYDVISSPVDSKNLLCFLQHISKNSPNVILYTLSDSLLPSLTAVTGAFRNVRMGAAWWFNDTLEGIKRNLRTISEYASLGNNLGMLTDSRSFSSYSRFDFFRRILCDFVGRFVENGEYDSRSVKELVTDICYRNAKELVL